MSAFYQGSTAAQWVGMLQTGALHERCAAALALAEFEPNLPPAKDALLAALRDAEMPVRVAAQIAISFIHTPAENRRRMFLMCSAGKSIFRASFSTASKAGRRK